LSRMARPVSRQEVHHAGLAVGLGEPHQGLRSLPLLLVRRGIRRSRGVDNLPDCIERPGQVLEAPAAADVADQLHSPGRIADPPEVMQGLNVNRGDVAGEVVSPRVDLLDGRAVVPLDVPSPALASIVPADIDPVGAGLVLEEGLEVAGCPAAGAHETASTTAPTTPRRRGGRPPCSSTIAQP
jgi:hypothetical protein